MSLDLYLIPGTVYPDGTPIDRAELRKGAKPVISLTGQLSTDQIASCAVTAAKVKTGAYWYATVTGTADVIVLTTACPLAALTSGAVVAFKASGTNTTVVTVAVDSLGAVALKKYGTTALAAGDLLSGAIYEIRYDGTYWQLISPAATALDSSGGGNPIAVDADPTDTGSGPYIKGVFTTVQGTPTATTLVADTDTKMGTCVLTLPAGKTWTWVEVYFSTFFNCASGSLRGMSAFKVKIGATTQTWLTSFAPYVSDNADINVEFHVRTEGPPSTTNATLTLDIYAQYPSPTTVTVADGAFAASAGDDVNGRKCYALGYFR